jgi:hypothetical protein
MQPFKKLDGPTQKVGQAIQKVNYRDAYEYIFIDNQGFTMLPKAAHRQTLTFIHHPDHRNQLIR